MDVTIKSLKHIKSRSEETNCFTATVLIDGKPLCAADNDGRGGPDNYLSIKGGPVDWRDQLAAVQVELAKESISFSEFTVPNSLEIVVGNLINTALIEKDVKSLIKRRVAYVTDKPGIYELPAKFKPSPELFEGLKKAPWWTDKHELLAEMPIERAIELYRKG